MKHSIRILFLSLFSMISLAGLACTSYLVTPGASTLAATAWQTGYRDRVTRLLVGDVLAAAGDVDGAVETVRGLSHAAERFLGQAWSYNQDGDRQRADYAAAAAERLK